MTEIRHIIFLIHPCCYEALPADSPVHRANIGVYVQREKEAKQRWLDDLSRHGRDTLCLQLYGPMELFDAVKQRLGEAGACYVKADWDSIPDGPDRLAEYYVRLTRTIREHVATHELRFDPATVTSEIWGESFEGCATNYSSAFAQQLGLRRKPKMRFEMTVYDSRFLFGAKGPEILSLPGSDIEVCLFELYDSTSAALFQSRLHAQYLDQRPIKLMLDPARVQACAVTGFTIWPKERPIRGLPQEPEPFTFTLAYPTPWIRGIGMGLDELREVCLAARVGEAQPSPVAVGAKA